MSEEVQSSRARAPGKLLLIGGTARAFGASFLVETSLHSTPLLTQSTLLHRIAETVLLLSFISSYAGLAETL